jgi:subtilisin-like proprotein convertase family protein
MKWTAALPIALLLFACGPRGNSTWEGGGGGGGGGGDYECTAGGTTETVCDDDRDDDCDGKWNCEDPDCSGVGDCPVCGEAQHEEGEPLALPDDGSGTSAYVSTITITGFGADQTITDVSLFHGVCVNMEHSWLRDLQIELTSPDGTLITLQQFLGTTGGEVYMGAPNDDDLTVPTPGIGADYCWTPTAMNPPMLDMANSTGVHDLPSGDYQAVSGFGGLVGTPLNGDWTIRVTDWWASDNGFIFSWTINFDPGSVEDCSEPID